MAQDFDVTIKLLFRQSKGLALTKVAGGGVKEWLNVELPSVRNPRVDLVGRRADGSLVHIEIDSQQEGDTGERAANYHLGLYTLFRVGVPAVVLYVGRQPLRMARVFSTGFLTMEYEVLDVRDFPGEEMLASEDLSDNMLAILTRADRDKVVDRVLARISELGGEARRTAIEVFVLLSGLRDIEEIVAERIKQYMPIVDIMENKVFGPRIREGIELGRKEGLQEGRQEGELRFLEALLRDRFQVVPEWAKARISGATEADLLKWGMRVHRVGSIEEVFAE